MQPPQNRKES
jgi:hypothetical protein